MYSILFTGDKAAPNKGVWCWCREEEHGDILMCKGPNCQVQWFQNVSLFFALHETIVQLSIFLVLTRLYC